ncbi:hypothetical protein RsoM2USA_88 [Ralstonia phage RsoM2USA]|nr:hypothetical protein RsoM2USA_88 [Ralstonia phage RsoM2USA]
MKLHEISERPSFNIAQIANKDKWTDEEIRFMINSQLNIKFEDQFDVNNGYVTFFDSLSGKYLSDALSRLARWVKRFPFDIANMKQDLKLESPDDPLALTSLEGLPDKIGGEFRISDAPNLRSLRGMPLRANEISLVDLRIPEIDVQIQEADVLFVTDCHELDNLKGAPANLLDLVVSRCNHISDLSGITNSEEIRLAKLTNLRSFEGISKTLKSCKKIFIDNMVIESNILGLLEVQDMQEVVLINPSLLPSDMKRAFQILNTHLRGNKDIFECQSDLIEAGLDRYAEI